LFYIACFFFLQKLFHELVLFITQQLNMNSSYDTIERAAASGDADDDDESYNDQLAAKRQLISDYIINDDNEPRPSSSSSKSATAENSHSSLFVNDVKIMSSYSCYNPLEIVIKFLLAWRGFV
jgi:hypothetical protein